MEESKQASGESLNGSAEPEDLTTAEVLGCSEFACWTMLTLAPILYHINGPSVSADQAVVRTILVTTAAVGAGVLRCANWRKR